MGHVGKVFFCFVFFLFLVFFLLFGLYVRVHGIWNTIYDINMIGETVEDDCLLACIVHYC